MYAAGLTVREIAEHCHRRDNTVRLHLQIRERHQPGLRAQHQTSLADRGPDRPTTGWRRRLTEAQSFHIERGRLPSYDGEPDERSLHAWIAAQRRANNHGTLPIPKIVLMESLPGWNASPRQQQRRRQLNERWCLRLSQLQDYVAATGQIPRWKRHSSEHERILGVWLHTQTQARSEGSLPQWRLCALDTALPGWHSTM